MLLERSDLQVVDILDIFDIGGNVDSGDIDIVSWDLFNEVNKELDFSAI